MHLSTFKWSKPQKSSVSGYVCRQPIMRQVEKTGNILWKHPHTHTHTHTHTNTNSYINSVDPHPGINKSQERSWSLSHSEPRASVTFVVRDPESSSLQSLLLLPQFHPENRYIRGMKSLLISAADHYKLQQCRSKRLRGKIQTRNSILLEMSLCLKRCPGNLLISPWIDGKTCLSS